MNLRKKVWMMKYVCLCLALSNNFFIRENLRKKGGMCMTRASRIKMMVTRYVCV